MYKNWRTESKELTEEQQEEYCKVADWCNEGQEYHIEDMGEYYATVKNPEPTVEELQQRVRAVRNSYLETYVDPVVSNPLRWDDLTEEEKQVYKDYRRYLLDYTENENWWLSNPLTLNEWKSE
jgi:hypothetical protein